MKKKHYKLCATLIGGTLAVLLCNCAADEHADDQMLTEAIETNAQLLDMPTTNISEAVVENVQESSVPDVPAAAIAPVAPIAPLSVPQDPRAYYRDTFDEGPTVAPWHANYIGSYGLLPTRFQDKGPELYSFDVSPEAFTAKDNNVGPMIDFFDHHADDDDL